MTIHHPPSVEDELDRLELDPLEAYLDDDVIWAARLKGDPAPADATYDDTDDDDNNPWPPAE